jgi:ubiquinone/menaquinone biosynthesis C-methylase UbiE
VELKGEVERIRYAYDRRKEFAGDRYSLFHPANQFMLFQREKKILELLHKHGLNPLSDKKILDVGCGNGGPLRDFISYGALPQNLYGLDLLEDKIEQARMLSPNIDFRCGNAEELPYEDGSFDIVMQFTVFTSILDDGMKRNVAKEMLRVLRPDGVILWYDYFVSKPTNRDTRGVRRKEIEGLFPGCIFDFHRITLAPPIARLVAPWSFLLCYLLELISWLRTHYLAVIRKV